MERDYNNYDYLSVSVNSDQLSRILQCYRALGWTEIKTEEDRQYYGMNYVRLRRPHKIENKDRLQYLQVRMESSVNSLVSITKRAHIKSNSVIAISVVLVLALIALSLWLVIACDGVWAILGWTGIGLAAALTIAAAVICTIMHRREKKTATGKIIEKLRFIQTLMEEASTLIPAVTEASEGLYDLVEEAENG